MIRIINADVMDGLAQLADESVQCVVTSPPYWGLRDYQTATWDGGNSDCDHLKVSDAVKAVATSTLCGGKKTTGHLQEGFKGACGKCGAIRIDNQIGLEPTPEAFVAKLVEVFREVRRVLRSDGVCWVNLGDSYNSGTQANKWEARSQHNDSDPQVGKYAGHRPLVAGIKMKDLVGIPWRVAFALQADGWYLRQEIIWAKPNPMPESVTDRCTKAHEHIFLLTKSARYFYDAKAIKEPQAEGTFDRRDTTPRALSKKSASADSRVVLANEGYDKARRVRILPDGRNKRSVWTIATQPFAADHFATFPEELPEICIKAGSKPGDTILDPFGGAGTTGLVADKLGRDAILIELSAEYAAMAERRIKGDCPMFASVEVTT